MGMASKMLGQSLKAAKVQGARRVCVGGGDLGRGRHTGSLRTRSVGRTLAKSNGDGGVSSVTTDLDLEEFNDVLRMVHDTDIVELSLKTNTFQISVRKKEALEQEAQEQLMASGMMMQQQPAPMAYAPAPVAPAPAAPAAEAPSTTPAAAAPAAAPAPVAPPAASPPDGKAITSPMSGTFYRSPAPGEPPFINEGDSVQKGQKVCIIEAMKLMNEIEAEVSGKVLELLVEDGTPVTPGQPLMIIS